MKRKGKKNKKNSSETHSFVNAFLAVLALLGVLDDRICGEKLIKVRQTPEGQTNAEERHGIIEERTM